jgi:hypothetical protein
VVTIGVDFAAQPKNTALCQMCWQDGRAEVTLLEVNVCDERILNLSETADKVGLDVPFGWPVAFVKSLISHRDGASWPRHSQRELCFRATDRFVHDSTGKWPLSVSTDRIGITAFRSASLLSRLALAGTVVDRTGTGKFVEVYPAGAVRQWGLGPATRKDTAVLAGAVAEKCSQWLRLADDVQARCATTRDALDALIASLVARAAAVGLCEPIPALGIEQVSRKGRL